MDFELIMDNNKLLQNINKIIHERTGIYLTKEKYYLLIHKLSRILKNKNYRNLADFYSLIKNGDITVIDNLINNITTNHTFFFREKNHLNILVNDILQKGKNNPIIWCAASSTGEEVYSIIIALLENKINNFLLIASDINKKVLLQMKKGIYNVSKLIETDKTIINKYFVNESKNGEYNYCIKDHLKKYFITKRINLIDNIKFEKQFDYIFCRNVLMYFNKDTQKKVINMLINNLKDYGYLFVGHSESLIQANNRIESVFSSVYNKKL
jgi:chemotaxis protein methyltransferase CheR